MFKDQPYKLEASLHRLTRTACPEKFGRMSKTCARIAKSWSVYGGRTSSPSLMQPARHYNSDEVFVAGYGF